MLSVKMLVVEYKPNADGQNVPTGAHVTAMRLADVPFVKADAQALATEMVMMARDKLEGKCKR